MLPRNAWETSFNKIHGSTTLSIPTTQDATTKGVLSLKGDLKKAHDCDVQAVQISKRLQDIKEGKEIAMLANEINPDEI